MTTEPNVAKEPNLALEPGVKISINVSNPTGGGSSDPRVLLNDFIYLSESRQLTQFAEEDGYNTYDGQNLAMSPDWYVIEFAGLRTFNCIEMTMALPHRDGGWWTSLAVEIYDANRQTWQSVQKLDITPNYDFENSRAGRRPYETYALTFPEVNAKALRLIGKPGGIAQFTSLARLGVYHRNLSRWNTTLLPEAVVPNALQLISPQTIWDIAENLMKACGLTITFPLLEYYLDAPRYDQLWRRVSHNYRQEPSLWFMLGETVGWRKWNNMIKSEIHKEQQAFPKNYYVKSHLDNTFASAVAPIVVDGEVLGELSTDLVILKDKFNYQWCRKFSKKYNVTWNDYLAAAERSPQITMEQLEGVGGLLGLIASNIAGSARHKKPIKKQSAKHRPEFSQHQELVRAAIKYMQTNLEGDIDVPDVARQLALSPVYFSTLFTEQTGRRPGEYLIELRIERAKEYLREGSLQIIDISTLLGLSPSYFSRLFKRKVGCTPGQYAQRVHV
jgi:AraC-like DNA-binding protein